MYWSYVIVCTDHMATNTTYERGSRARVIARTSYGNSRERKKSIFLSLKFHEKPERFFLRRIMYFRITELWYSENIYFYSSYFSMVRIRFLIETRIIYPDTQQTIGNWLELSHHNSSQNLMIKIFCDQKYLKSQHHWKLTEVIPFHE